MNNLKSLRGPTYQSTFAASLNIPYIDRPLYSKIESGYVLPNPEDAEIIARRLGKTVREIWPDYPGIAPVHSQPPKKASCACAHGSNAEKYEAVTRHIPFGWMKSISRRSLCEITELTDREVRQRIEDARNDGEFILSFAKGYYKTNDLMDLARYWHKEYSRAISIIKRLSPIRRYLDRNVPGQIVLGNCWRCGDEAHGDFCENCETILRERETASATAIASAAQENYTASV